MKRRKRAAISVASRPVLKQPQPENLVTSPPPENPYDWWEPWWTLLKLINMIASHAVGFFAIVTITRALELGIGLVSAQPLIWTARGATISLSDIVHYGDLVVFAAFIFVIIVDLVKWALWR
jgi:hypothetical protein